MDNEKIPEPEEVAALFWSLADDRRTLRDLYRTRAVQDQSLANLYEDQIEDFQALGNAMRPDSLKHLRTSDPGHYEIFARALASNTAAGKAEASRLREEDSALTQGFFDNFSIAASGAALTNLGVTIAESMGVGPLVLGRSALDQLLADPSRAKLRAYLNSKGRTFGRMLDGSWETLYGYGSDRSRQAASSMRELIRMILDILAPREEVASKLGLKDAKNPDGSTKSAKEQITHAMQVKFAMEGAPDHLVLLGVRDYDLVMGWERGIYSASNVPVHSRDQVPAEAITGILLAGEALLNVLMAYAR